jgi:hypothetical protein
VYLVVAPPNIEADEVGTMGVGVSLVWSSFSWDPPQAALVSNLWHQEIDGLEEYISHPITNEKRTASEEK